MGLNKNSEYLRQLKKAAPSSQAASSYLNKVVLSSYDPIAYKRREVEIVCTECGGKTIAHSRNAKYCKPCAHQRQVDRVSQAIRRLRQKQKTAYKKEKILKTIEKLQIQLEDLLKEEI